MKDSPTIGELMERYHCASLIELLVFHGDRIQSSFIDQQIEADFQKARDAIRRGDMLPSLRTKC